MFMQRMNSFWPFFFDLDSELKENNASGTEDNIFLEYTVNLF